MGPEAMIFIFWILSFKTTFLSPLSLSSRGSLVLLHFLPKGWCHLHVWGNWYFSQKSWFQLVPHPAWHFAWCTLHLNKQFSSVQSLSSVRLFATPSTGNLPGSSVHGILQARLLEWVAISFSRGSSWLRNWTQISYIADRFFTDWATREALKIDNTFWRFTLSDIHRKWWKTINSDSYFF